MLVRVVEVLDMDEKPKHIREQDIRKMKDSGDIEGLIEALDYAGRRDIRMYAAMFLGRMGDRRAVEPLIRVLKDKGSDIRQWAAYALGELGDLRALDPLLQALRDTEWEVRKKATIALGKLGDVSAVEPLIQVLNDENWEVRWRAAEALGKLGDGRAAEHLVLLLREKDPRDEEGEVLRAAAEALDKLGWKPENDLDRVYYLMAKGEWEKLAELGWWRWSPYWKHCTMGGIIVCGSARRKPWE
ncbi:MAG: HEAT repeat domain-containing protein [Candidatus Lokiarchaeia archaeon]